MTPKPNTENLDPDQLLDKAPTPEGEPPEPDPTPDEVTDPSDPSYVEPYK